ncbi:MAG: DUF503 domain-containing protein [Thermotogae bacterium]|nr:DUF503 domain-containing protein [Thermotogota bacterium]
MLGILVVEIHLPFVRSLKEKRKYIHRLRAISREFNAAFSVIDNHDKWQLATVAFVLVGNGSQGLDSALERIIDRIDERYEILGIKKSIEPIAIDIL